MAVTRGQESVADVGRLTANMQVSITVLIHMLTTLPGQLSLLPSAGREMSTSQSVVMLCSWGVKAGVVHSTCG